MLLLSNTLIRLRSTSSILPASCYILRSFKTYTKYYFNGRKLLKSKILVAIKAVNIVSLLEK